VIQSQLKDTVLLGTLRYSRSLQEADLRRAPVFGADAEVTEQLKQAKNKLVELISGSSSKGQKTIIDNIRNFHYVTDFSF